MGLLIFLILMPFTKLILLLDCLYCELQNLLYLHVCPGLSKRLGYKHNTKK